MSKKILTPLDLAEMPDYIYPPYASTPKRGPSRPMIPRVETLSELTGPVYGVDDIAEIDSDLTKNGRVNGEPIGERIIVTGRVLDENGDPVKNTLVEVWQANATGRYLHHKDQHDAPLDPNFTGGGRMLTDNEGRYRFTSIRPGAYPWPNHYNAWRPAHIHFSIFGHSFYHGWSPKCTFPVTHYSRSTRYLIRFTMQPAAIGSSPHIITTLQRNFGPLASNLISSLQAPK